MAKIVADREIRKLVGTVILSADANCINPNGIELRLGKHVHYHSTGEEKELEDGCYLKVSPGETVSISSIEQIDFSVPTVQKFFPNAMLMGFITPTTTMMREGISQVATKIDAGFRGTLNWGLRNGSTRNLILQYGEPIFKLTLFLLEDDEIPETPYGQGESHYYQDTNGIKRSARRLPADIPKSKIVSSSFEQLDPKKQLREAGYPFDHIGTELTALHGKFEVVSKDVLLLKDQFEQRTKEITSKIDTETRTLLEKVTESKESLLEKVEALFQRKFLSALGVIIGSIPIIYGGINFLQDSGLKANVVSFITVMAGVLILLLTYVLSRRG